MKVINALIAPPGSGKTTWLIDRLSKINDQYSVLVFPTKILSLEVQRRLESMNLAHNAIDSSTVEGSVTQCLEESLNNRNDKIIICTHESLRLINPVSLEGWNLYVDEVPTTWACSTCSFTNLSFHTVFDDIVNIVKVGNKDRLIARDDRRSLIAELTSRAESTLSNEAQLVMSALLDDRQIVEVDKIDAKHNRVVRIIGIKNYIPAFAAAVTTVLMGAEIAKTLLGVILKGAGWSISPIEVDLGFEGYGNEVIIHPFFMNKNYSKTVALMKGGKIYQEYQEDCLLDAWLQKDVFRLIGRKKAILIAHEWCRPQLPMLKNSDSSNVKFIKIDNRGINDYAEYGIAICLQHGNITPIENRSLTPLAELLSTIDEVSADEVKHAIKYERFYESTLQSVCRTALRSKTNSGAILLFVQDLEIAKFLAAKIGNCTIDETYSEIYLPPASEAKTNRLGLQSKAVALWEDGNHTKFIAEKLGKTERTVREWLKPYRQLKC